MCKLSLQFHWHLYDRIDNIILIRSSQVILTTGAYDNFNTGTVFKKMQIDIFGVFLT